MPKREYDVILVGAGLGGLVCSALLAKWGLRVVVLDKNKEPGGKQIGVSVRGFKGEMWPTYGIPKEASPFGDAFKQLGFFEKRSYNSCPKRVPAPPNRPSPASCMRVVLISGCGPVGLGAGRTALFTSAGKSFTTPGIFLMRLNSGAASKP